jgi:hypothetical protein
MPFPASAPAFLTYLREERGVRPATIEHYQTHLEAFGTYLARLDLEQPAAFSPVVLSGFITDTSRGLCTTSIKLRAVAEYCACFWRYLRREQHLPPRFERGGRGSTDPSPVGDPAGRVVGGRPADAGAGRSADHRRSPVAATTRF